MKAGAIEFLTKPLVSEVLLDAIRDAVERSSAVLAADAAMHSLRQCYASLTTREREVMSLVIGGLLNKQIGADLCISEITVKAHRGSMMRKMKANSVPHLVNMAAKLGVASGDGSNRRRSSKLTTRLWGDVSETSMDQPLTRSGEAARERMV